MELRGKKGAENINNLWKVPTLGENIALDGLMSMNHMYGNMARPSARKCTGGSSFYGHDFNGL